MERIAFALVGTAAIVALIRRDTPRASAGFVRAACIEPPRADAGPRCGCWFLSQRSDLLMGHGPRSITSRALEHLARELNKPDPETWAKDTTRRAVLARAILEAPQNRRHLRPARGRMLKTAEGLTLDTRRSPLISIPAMHEKNGVLCG